MAVRRCDFFGLEDGTSLSRLVGPLLSAGNRILLLRGLQRPSGDSGRAMVCIWCFGDWCFLVFCFFRRLGI